MSKLKIVERRRENVTILDLTGKIQIGESSVLFRCCLKKCMSNGESNLLLNLAGVSQVDSSGLGEFVSGVASFRRSGGEIKLLNLTDRVNELMVITKLLTVFEVYEVEDKAIESFKRIPEYRNLDRSKYVTSELDEAQVRQHTVD